MAIDKAIYVNGINGMLSYWEIENLPRDYEVYKAMFKEATDVKNGIKQDTHKPMSRLKQEKRMLQVLSRATYGMDKYNMGVMDKISNRQKVEGYDYNRGTEKPTFRNKFNRFMFYLKPKRLWNIISFYWKLRKALSKDTKRYVEASKEYDAVRKETEKLYKKNMDYNYKYDMKTGKWEPYTGSC